MPPLNGQDKTPDNKGIDLSKILLPKKETGPQPESAQRINAGALLSQEQNAQLPKPETPVAAPAPAAAQNSDAIKPLQTYRGDIEGLVAGKGVSVVSVAAAEAERRGKNAGAEQAATKAVDKKILGLNIAMVAGGVALVAAALGTAAFVLLRQTSVPPPQVVSAPFIFVDDTVLVSPGARTRDALMTNLAAARQQVSLSLGLVAWLYVAEPGPAASDAPTPLAAAEFLQILSPDVPQELVRVLEPTYLVGVHSFDENQPFLLLRVDSYETAYAAMLAWERTVQGDLAPFFKRNPSPRLPAPPSGTQTGTTTATTTENQQFLQTGFVDKIVENRDTRAVVNDAGDLLLLWTMLGRNTVLITTNEYTLREVISRMSAAPVVPIPGS